MTFIEIHIVNEPLMYFFNDLHSILHDKEKAALLRKIPIQNRSIFVICLFSPHHMYYHLFGSAYRMKERSKKT